MNINVHKLYLINRLCYISILYKLKVVLIILFAQYIKALPGVWGNRGTRSIISGEQGNQNLKLKENGEQRQFWGKEHRKSRF